MADLSGEVYRLQQKNDLLKQLISVMNTSPKLDNILRHITDLICLVTTCEAAVLMLKEVIEGDNLTIKAVAGLDKKLVGKEWAIGSGIVGEAYCSGREVIVNNPSSESGHSPDFGILINMPVNNLLVIPLNDNGSIIGVIAGINKKSGLKFNEEDLDMAMVVAEQAAQLSGQSAIFKSVEAKLRRFNTLLSVSKEITQLDNLHILLQRIMEAAKKVMRAEASSLFLLDDKANELYIETAQGEAGEQIKTIRLPVGRGIAGWVAQKGRPQLVLDAYEDERFDSSYDRKTGFRTKSIVCVPLEYKNKITGVIQIINALDKETFDEEDVDYMIALAGSAAVAIENARLLLANKELFLNVIMAMVTLIDSRHKYFAGHSMRVANYAVAIGRVLGLPASEIEKLNITALVHDIGRLQVPDNILLKPGTLSEPETKVIRMIPLVGARILSGIKMMDYVVPGILYHMEAYNGKGYPKGLAGEQIPLTSKIIGLCNVFDAMCSPRPYREAMTFDNARNKVITMGGTQFDPLIVKAFQKAVETGRIQKPETPAPQ